MQTSSNIRKYAIWIFASLGCFAILGSQFIRQSHKDSGWLGAFATFLLSFIDREENQWLLALCFGSYFIGFTIVIILLQKRVASDCAQSCGWSLIKEPEIFLVLLIGFAGTAYWVEYPTAYHRSDFLTLLVGSTIALGLAALRLSRKDVGLLVSIRSAILPSMLLTLMLASVFHLDMGKSFAYREQARWSGVFFNPNTFGLLMGVGVVLAIGRIGEKLTLGRQHFKSQKLRLILLTIGFGLMCLGLIKSYSRGAWVALVCGLLYLCSKSFTASRLPQVFRRICGNWLIGGAIVVFGFILAFWHSRHSEQDLLRRLFSMGNVNDFSWSNRMAAWEGAMQMMASKLWLGFGWNQSEPVYDQFYRISKIAEGAAIQVNDYFILGTSLGFPALCCFLIFSWLALKHPAKGPVPSQNPDEALDSACLSSETVFVLRDFDWAANASRAGAVVLLVGFWFDGGLFWLATGLVFCILLVLGTGTNPLQESSFGSSKGQGRLRSRWLRLPVFWRRIIATTGIIGLLMLIMPPLQVLYCRFTNPLLTLPSFLQETRSKASDLEAKTKQQVWEHLRDASPDFLTCVWIAEDGRFFQHSGFDWDEIMKARKEAKRTGKPSRGASTITQQCARSLFLWQGRSWIRKGLEAYYTIWMELLLSKERILELYVNVIELGDGIYGIEAAAQHYYEVSSADLTREQAAMLVAIMPNPRGWDPLNPNERVQRRHAVILQRTEHANFPLSLEEKR